MQLEFTNKQLDKFDNALDLLYSKGYTKEIHHQPPKMIGDRLIQYSVMRIDPEIRHFTYGDILVKLILQGADCNLEFGYPYCGELRDLSAKEILALPNH